MSQHQKTIQYKLRLDEDLMNLIRQSAGTHTRSINTEINHQLRKAYQMGETLDPTTNQKLDRILELLEKNDG